MKKIVFLLTVVLFFSLSLIAQEWSLLEAPTTNEIATMAITDNNLIMVVDVEGKTYYSESFGEHWIYNPLAIALSPNYQEMSTFNSDIYIATENGLAKFDTDEYQWKYLLTGKMFSTICSNENGLFALAGSVADNYRSFDGETWEEINPPNSFLIENSFGSLSDNAVTAVCYDGPVTTLHRSYDHGDSWQMVDQLNVVYISDADCGDSSDEYCVVGEDVSSGDPALFSSGVIDFSHLAGRVSAVNHFNGEWLMGGTLFIEGNPSNKQGFLMNNDNFYNIQLTSEEIVAIESNNYAALAATKNGNIYCMFHYAGVEDNYQKDLKIYPNPATSYINIEVKKETLIKIVNMQGQVIISQDVPIGTTKLDVTNLAEGIYIINNNKQKFVVR